MNESSESMVMSDTDDVAPEGALTTDDASDEVGRLAHIIESILFASATPVSLRRLVDVLEGPTLKEVQVALARLKAHYAPGERGIQLQEVAGGYQFRTARENAAWVRAVFRDKPARLGRAALETLAIIAYKQPVTRPEIEAIRGVDVDGVVSTLLSRRLIKTVGRKEAVGRPLLYGTTPDFLETFGLKDLKELPSLKELGPAPDTEDAETASALEQQEETPPTESSADAARECAAAEPATDAGSAAGAPAEDPEPSGDRLAAEGGGTDPDGPGPGKRSRRDPAGDEGEPADGSDHD